MTAYLVEGPSGGTPLVLLHAIGTSGALWDDVARPLARTRQIIRVDFWGHGHTPPKPGPYSLDGLAQDVLGVLDQLGAVRAHVAGVSLGGMVAQALAALAPDRVATLGLIATALHIPTPAMWRDRAALVRAQGMAPLADAALPRWVTDAAPDDVRLRLRTILLGTAPEGYAGAAEAIADADLTARTSALRVRTLVLVGDADVATTPAMARALRDAVAGADLRVIEQAAHLPMAERPDAVTAALREFLRD